MSETRIRFGSAEECTAFLEEIQRKGTKNVNKARALGLLFAHKRHRVSSWVEGSTYYVSVTMDSSPMLREFIDMTVPEEEPSPIRQTYLVPIMPITKEEKDGPE